MGEVYRARDTRLGRDVAIKVLPTSFAGNADRLSRFEQEACAASALNHPNILTIFDIGKDDGSPYVVSELLEGATLRDQLDGSPLPQRKAIDYALQIARGLAAAHEKGIVHRDLKPENLFVTKDGRVKILDFGLAKLLESTTPGEVATEAPTRKVSTDPGMVMGTVGYMSPEQVRGHPVDHRSDIFSFGTILYEMLTGKRAFRHDSAIETLNAILKEDPPDLIGSNQQINPAVERILNHCLEKSPEQRFHSARDLAFALEALSGTASFTNGQTVSMPVPAEKGVSRREIIAWTIAGIVLLAAVAGVFVFWPRRGNDQAAGISRFQLTPPEKKAFGGPPMISPDGRRIVTRVRGSDGNVSLWIRPIESIDAQPLHGTEDGNQPFWSPDSRAIGFFANGKLKKVDVTGGPVQTICDATLTGGGSWSRDGTILFVTRFEGGLSSVPAAGGAPKPATTVDKDRKEIVHHWPYFLPDGLHFLYSVRSSKPENGGIFVGTLGSDERKPLISGIDSSMSYAPPGYILFVRENALMAQPFDPDKLELAGDAFPVVEKVGFNEANGRAHFSVSETGTLIYRAQIPSNEVQLAWCDRTGKQIAAVGSASKGVTVELSPDEKRVAGVRRDDDKPSINIWIIDLERAGAATRLTFDPTAAIMPVWSPDGGRIIFASARDGPPNLYQRLASGAGNDEVLLRSDKVTLPTDYSRDGRYILFNQTSEKTQMDLWVLPVADGGEPAIYLQTDFNELGGRFSPDGQWVAYVSNEAGQNEVYVRSFPAADEKWQVSTTGGMQPRWRNDGKELFYLNEAGKLMAVDVKNTSRALEFGVPKPLFDVRVGFNSAFSPYAVSHDGQRFLVSTNVEEAQPSPLIVVTNWTTELRR